MFNMAAWTLNGGGLKGRVPPVFSVDGTAYNIPTTPPVQFRNKLRAYNVTDQFLLLKALT